MTHSFCSPPNCPISEETPILIPQPANNQAVPPVRRFFLNHPKTILAMVTSLLLVSTGILVWMIVKEDRSCHFRGEEQDVNINIDEMSPFIKEDFTHCIFDENGSVQFSLINATANGALKLCGKMMNFTKGMTEEILPCFTNQVQTVGQVLYNAAVRLDQEGEAWIRTSVYELPYNAGDSSSPGLQTQTTHVSATALKTAIEQSANAIPKTIKDFFNAAKL